MMEPVSMVPVVAALFQACTEQPLVGVVPMPRPTVMVDTGSRVVSVASTVPFWATVKVCHTAERDVSVPVKVSVVRVASEPVVDEVGVLWLPQVGNSDEKTRAKTRRTPINKYN